jgi:hypothetical protein
VRRGKVGDLVQRVVVWGYDLEYMGCIEEEIKEFIPSFTFLDFNTSEAVFSLEENGPEHTWASGLCLVYDLYKGTLVTRDHSDVILMFRKAV